MRDTAKQKNRSSVAALYRQAGTPRKQPRKPNYNYKDQPTKEVGHSTLHLVCPGLLRGICQWDYKG
jgi:hypothetical protein